MRRFSASALFLSLAAFSAAAGELPRGAYAAASADDEAACVRLCADDALCVSWMFQQSNNICALRATRATQTPVTLAAAPEAQPSAAPEQTAAPATDGLLGGPEAAPAPLDIRSR